MIRKTLERIGLIQKMTKRKPIRWITPKKKSMFTLRRKTSTGILEIEVEVNRFRTIKGGHMNDIVSKIK